MAYFKRATTWLALGKSKAALPDLNKSIKLKPDFSPAIVSKASILLKQGFLEDAKKYYKKTVRKSWLVCPYPVLFLETARVLYILSTEVKVIMEWYYIWANSLKLWDFKFRNKSKYTFEK